ncbi:hypothetical protein LJR225_004293 [Phenylobacterium sp. LjRoot225]|uniref:hypothetical protein n=1 Tax=Phenylobacterium sp. LjRoot225 TaxID=3342285 RepID=UPI003ECE3E53
MGEPTSDDPALSIRRKLAGAVMVLVGGLTLVALVFISNSQNPTAAHMMFSLGLAGSALLSATAQGLIFAGAWMLWRATRRRPR